MRIKGVFIIFKDLAVLFSFPIHNPVIIGCFVLHHRSRALLEVSEIPVINTKI